MTEYDYKLGLPNRWEEVDTSKDTVFTVASKGFKITGSGLLALRDCGGNIVRFPVVAGELLEVAASAVIAYGTTATGVIALF